jgi:hypothetical protein
MDYVFELPASMPRREKANTILRDVVQKTQYYHSLRRVRAPKALEEGIAAAVAAAREKNNEMTAGLAAASCNKGQQAVGPGQQPGMPGQQGITQGMAQGMQQAHQHQQQQQYQQQAQHHQQQQQQQQQHQQQHAQHQQQPTRDRVNYPDPIPSDEFRNFTFMPDIQYYAREAHRPSLSPQSSEADSSRQPWGSTGCPPNQKVEIDWVRSLGFRTGHGLTWAERVGQAVPAGPEHPGAQPAGLQQQHPARVREHVQLPVRVKRIVLWFVSAQ